MSQKIPAFFVDDRDDVAALKMCLRNLRLCKHKPFAIEFVANSGFVRLRLGDKIGMNGQGTLTLGDGDVRRLVIEELNSFMTNAFDAAMRRTRKDLRAARRAARKRILGKVKVA